MRSTWTITASPGDKIKLTFNSFSLQPDTSCRYDYLAVYDGDKETDNLLGRYCSHNPGLIESTRNKLLVVFHTDDSWTSSGFIATWKTEKDDIKGTGMSIYFHGNCHEMRKTYK